MKGYTSKMGTMLTMDTVYWITRWFSMLWAACSLMVPPWLIMAPKLLEELR